MPDSVIAKMNLAVMEKMCYYGLCWRGARQRFNLYRRN